MIINKSQNSRGALLIILSMFAFAFEDVLLKFQSASVPVGQMLIWVGGISSAMIAVQIAVQREAFFNKANWQPILIFRAFLEGLQGITFVTALSLVDISVVAAVFQTTPLMTTLLAAVFLKEAVGWRRWSAICLGFFGVLLVVRPGMEGFEPAALIVVASVIIVAVRDLITRAMPDDVPSSMVAFQALFMVVPCGAFLLFVQGSEWQALTITQIGLFALTALVGIIGYLALIYALRTAETGAIMPFRYSRLVFSILAGMIFFSESPDRLTYIGAALIIIAGLYTFLRERQLSRAKTTS